MGPWSDTYEAPRAGPSSPRDIHPRKPPPVHDGGGFSKKSPLFLDERALAQSQRLGGVIRRNRRDQSVVVPRIFRLFRLLHLEQIGRNEMAAVGAERGLAEHGIVGRNFLHPGDDLGAVMRVAAERFQGL